MFKTDTKTAEGAVIDFSILNLARKVHRVKARGVHLDRNPTAEKITSHS